MIFPMSILYKEMFFKTLAVKRINVIESNPSFNISVVSSDGVGYHKDLSENDCDTLFHIKEKILDERQKNQDGKQIEQKLEQERRRVRLETSLSAVVKMSHLHMCQTQWMWRTGKS